jgi:glycine oxidase
MIFGRGGYLVPRADGTLLCGSTEEEVGYDRAVTLGGVASILEMATGLAPALRDAPVCDLWSSFRPATPDGLPLIGPLDIEGLFVASGHFRNGILLGPITGEIIRDQIVGPVPSGLEALSPTRFAGSEPGTIDA